MKRSAAGWRSAAAVRPASKGPSAATLVCPASTIPASAAKIRSSQWAGASFSTPLTRTTSRSSIKIPKTATPAAFTSSSAVIRPVGGDRVRAEQASRAAAAGRTVAAEAQAAGNRAAVRRAPGAADKAAAGPISRVEQEHPDGPAQEPQRAVAQDRRGAQRHRRDKRTCQRSWISFCPGAAPVGLRLFTAVSFAKCRRSGAVGELLRASRQSYQKLK
jgi:hypothetical protein